VLDGSRLLWANHFEIGGARVGVQVRAYHVLNSK